MSEPTNILTCRLEQYIRQQEQINEICSINSVLQIISEAVEDVLPALETAKVELHHFGQYTTIIITVPGDSDIAKHGPYTYKLRTER